jgi:Holliday junction resolvase RusA-like endonuclease
MSMNKLNDSTIHEGSQALFQVVYGEPASKANSRKIVRFGNLSRLIKSDKARAYVETFLSQAKPVTPLLTEDVRVIITIYYASRRPDLDESLILDLLQGVFYVNDRQVKEKHIFWGLDKDCPRAEIAVEPMGKKIPAGRGEKLLEGENSMRILP